MPFMGSAASFDPARRRERPLLGALLQFGLTVVGVLLAILVAPWTPWFDQALSRWQYVEPSCENPRGLTKLDIASMAADNAVGISVSSEVDEVSSTPLHAFDGRPGSGWVPATISARHDEAAQDAPVTEDWVSLAFEEAQPIQLICVVNGNASDPISYARADRARTVEVTLRTEDGTITHLAPLQSLPDNEMQNRQSLGVRPHAGFGSPPEHQEVSLAVVDRYLGHAVNDPNMGSGLSEPTGKMMLAEIELWKDVGP